MSDNNPSQITIEQLESRLDEYYEPAEEGKYYFCQRETEGRMCRTKVYFSEKNPDDLRHHELKHGYPFETPGLPAADEAVDISVERKKLLDEVHRLGEALGRIPSTTDLREHGNRGYQDYYHEFKNWQAVLNASKWDVEEELTAAIVELAEQVEHRIIPKDVRQDVKYPNNWYHERFDSWQEAFEKAGLDYATREKLLEYVDNLGQILRRLPQKEDIQNSDYRVEEFDREFEDWTALLEASSLDVEQELVGSIQATSQRVDGRVIPDDIQKKAEYPVDWYKYWFDGWDDAFQAAEINTPSEDDLKDTLIGISKSKGRIPRRQYLAQRDVRFEEFEYVFGSWDAALEAAGFDKRKQLMSELLRFKEPVERISREDIKARSQYSLREFENTFGSTEDALEAANATTEKELGRAALEDRHPFREDLLANLRELREEIGQVPSPEDTNAHGRYSSDAYYCEIGDWVDVLEAMGWDIEAVLVTAIKEVSTEHDRPISRGDIVKGAKYPSNWFEELFASWAAAFEAAGVAYYSKSNIVELVKQIHTFTTRFPLIEDLATIEIRKKKIKLYFSGIEGLLDEAGIQVKNELEDEIIRIAELVDRAPTPTDIEAYSRYPLKFYKKYYANIEATIERARPLSGWPAQKFSRYKHPEIEPDRHPTLPLLTEDGERPPENQSSETTEADVRFVAGDQQAGDTEIVTTVQEVASSHRIPLTPSVFQSDDRIDAEQVVSVYGSFAQLCLALGIPYQVPNAGQSPDHLPGERGKFEVYRKMLEELFSIVNSQDPVSAIDLDEMGNFAEFRLRSFFGSVPAALLEVGYPWEALDIVDAVQRELELAEQVATTLGHPPSKSFLVNHHQHFPNLNKIFISGDTLGCVIECEHTEPNRTAELAMHLEALADALGHRPNNEEIHTYLNIENFVMGAVPADINEALNRADIPESRVLTPERSLLKQRAIESIPSHTDLLVEIKYATRQHPKTDIEELIRDETVINERHFKIQFGSISDAILEFESVDSRGVRDKKAARNQHVPRLEIAEMVDDLIDILERRPTPAEFILLGEADIDSLCFAFDSWEEISEDLFLGSPPTNEELLDDLVRVGHELGHPPLLDEYRGVGRYPTVSYIRRFGSWPQTLLLVGVDTSDGVPEEYLAYRTTAELWRITDELLYAEYSTTDLLIDELYRLAFDLGGQPTVTDIREYSPYVIKDFKQEFGSVKNAVKEAGIPDEGKEPWHPTRDELAKELRQQIGENHKWVLPQTVSELTELSPGLLLGVFGSWEDALDCAEYPTQHLEGSTETYGEAWSEDHQLKTAILRSIRQAEDHVGDVPTVQEFEHLSSISQNVVYRFFDTWDEALDAAGARGASWTPTINVEETDIGNPDFVDGLLEEIDKHIEES